MNGSIIIILLKHQVNLNDAVDAVSLKLRMENIFQKIKLVKMVSIVYAKNAEMREVRKMLLGKNR